MIARLQLSFTSVVALGCTRLAASDDGAGSDGSESDGSESGGSESDDSTSQESEGEESGDSDSDTTESADDGQDLLPTCGEPGGGGNLPGPPTLVSAAFVDDLVVQLTFSEPLAPFDEVDPASFRISIGSYNAYYMVTLYEDPMSFFCSHTDGCIGDYTDVVELGCVEGSPESMLLRLDVFWTEICGIIDYSIMNGGYVFVVLPHFDAGAGAIVDLDGEPLASIAEHWVMSDALGVQVAGEFSLLPMMVPIPCSL